jgi:micrococcal nuclease
VPVAQATRLAAIAVLAGACHDAGGTTAVVTRVIDGDTVELASGEKIRYLMVNAPETTNGHDDCYGSNAATFNSDLVLDKTVTLDYDVVKTDMFGRTLAYVTVDGQEVNSLLLERGYACLLHIPPNGDDRLAEFKALETAAKTANRGLWGSCSPIPCN